MTGLPGHPVGQALVRRAVPPEARVWILTLPIDEVLIPLGGVNRFRHVEDASAMQLPKGVDLFGAALRLHKRRGGRPYVTC